jgi:hypothetical protein
MLGCRPNPDYRADGPTRIDGSNSRDGGHDGSDGVGTSNYQPTAVWFQTQNNSYLTTGALADVGPQYISQRAGTFSLWLHFTARDSQLQSIVMATTTDGVVQAGIARTVDNQFHFVMPNCAGKVLLDMSTGTGHRYTAASGWVHLLAAWDVSAGSAAIYVNGMPDMASGATIINGDLCYVADQWGVGGLIGGQLDAEVADLYGDLGGYQDITQPEVRSRFIDSNYKPVDLGESCRNPTSSPAIGCLNGVAATWNVNQGTGGGMIVNGHADPIPVAETNPGD